ncbi:sensor histidine kinase [Pelagibacterium halotolerans]|uniref:histidine kinase n=1 Tax=Pelagibacterium halotolerans (strain DSM 22347 / JCM 15775 / CGMCC 1.7692 / B2) TaxID=1082931 RepID=G4RG93_PELHB|nr:HAMP domain-containing sensor histidine kinase [Pelagibacterium halotolerans]AEQ53069.1 two-component hybrid sensor and regulator [Pelagibacterium halotolerans B2]QJR17280.1 HAMP domain-containing histidine kinase [Pelagibacterium halotolerans]SEA87215.1 Signal transduction histidine kinase [Pelagibacterium halotolerans]
MILGRWNSLRSRLTRKLVLFQILALIAFALIASVPISRFATGVGLDDRVVGVIADAITFEDGRMAIDPDNEMLSKISARFPGFWYYARTDRGQVVSDGPIPEAFAPALEYLGYISFGDFGSEDFPEVAALIVRQAGSEAGRVHIATGGGPRFDWLSVGLLFANKYFVIFSAALSLVLIVAIPFTLRRALKGLDEVAREAAHIDIHQPGMRLTTDDVPLEMQPLVTAFNDALGRIDEGIERRHRFMADAAHELRTPIAILQTRVELLDPSPERSQLMLDVARLSNLADQLLDLQRIDVGHSRFETVDLVKLGAEAAAEMAPLVIASDDEIAFDSDADTVNINGDRVALMRAVTNLIQNAISHAGQSARINVSVSSDGSLTVGDSGPGIDPTQRARIFEPFYRVKPSTRGAGLGLNLVQEIVLRHKGTIKVGQSAQGGAAFTIALPLASPQP